MAAPRKWLPTEAPLYYTQVAQFLVDTTPSGAVGAEAKVDFPLNNRPEHAYGLRFAVFYTLPEEFERENYDFREKMRTGGTDQGFTVTIEPTQTDLTADPTPIESIRGHNGINNHPFPAPMLFRGGNDIKVTCRRTIAYPVLEFGDPLQEFRITPTIHMTLVSGQLISDLFPQGPPGSTGIPE